MTEVELVLGGVHHWQHLEEDHLRLHAMLQNLLDQCSHHHWTQSHFQFHSQYQSLWPLNENKINEHTVHAALCNLELEFFECNTAEKHCLPRLQIIFFSWEDILYVQLRHHLSQRKLKCGLISAKKVENFIFLKLPRYYMYFLNLLQSITYNYYFNSKTYHFTVMRVCYHCSIILLI